MSNGFPLIDIIFFAAVALFIAMRLRNVLGKRTGHERRPEPPLSPSSPDNVVKLPGRDDLHDGPFGHVQDPELREGLNAVRRHDGDFDLEYFLGGATGAFDMIVQAFANGDTETLRPLLADEVYAGFAEAIEQREAAGETLETQITAMKSAEIVEARMEGTRALLSVRFVTDQVNVTRNTSGAIVDGDPNDLHEVIDVWTFARDTASRDPNWLLVATSAES
ncbi:MAG: Tim44 domain-containing protein [Geminicoccaceae bacterium]|nr:MAG: Tim44 domain-containing protein [Geminicoccaceae bacterium]